MTVITNNIGSTSSNGTINELVIVRVSGDEVKTIDGRDTLDILSINNGIYHKRCELAIPSHAHQYFFVFQ